VSHSPDLLLQVSYMAHSHAMQYLKFFLWRRNQTILEKLSLMQQPAGLEQAT
jgi:hypothetical protein